MTNYLFTTADSFYEEHKYQPSYHEINRTLYKGFPSCAARTTTSPVSAQRHEGRLTMSKTEYPPQIRYSASIPIGLVNLPESRDSLPNALRSTPRRQSLWQRTRFVWLLTFSFLL